MDINRNVHSGCLESNIVTTCCIDNMAHDRYLFIHKTIHDKYTSIHNTSHDREMLDSTALVTTERY